MFSVILIKLTISLLPEQVMVINSIAKINQIWLFTSSLSTDLSMHEPWHLYPNSFMKQHSHINHKWRKKRWSKYFYTRWNVHDLSMDFFISVSNKRLWKKPCRSLMRIDLTVWTSGRCCLLQGCVPPNWLNFREVLFTAGLCFTQIWVNGWRFYGFSYKKKIFSFFCEFTKQNDSHGESCPSTLTKGRDRGFYTSVLTYRACV